MSDDRIRSWNYRVRSYNAPAPEGSGLDPEPVFEVIEAYYNDADEIVAWATYEKLQAADMDDLKDNVLAIFQATYGEVIPDDALPRPDHDDIDEFRHGRREEVPPNPTR